MNFPTNNTNNNKGFFPCKMSTLFSLPGELVSLVINLAQVGSIKAFVGVELVTAEQANKEGFSLISKKYPLANLLYSPVYDYLLITNVLEKSDTLASSSNKKLKIGEDEDIYNNQMLYKLIPALLMIVSSVMVVERSSFLRLKPQRERD